MRCPHWPRLRGDLEMSKRRGARGKAVEALSPSFDITSTTPVYDAVKHNEVLFQQPIKMEREFIKRWFYVKV